MLTRKKGTERKQKKKLIIFMQKIKNKKIVLPTYTFIIGKVTFDMFLFIWLVTMFCTTKYQ